MWLKSLMHDYQAQVKKYVTCLLCMKDCRQFSSLHTMTFSKRGGRQLTNQAGKDSITNYCNLYSDPDDGAKTIHVSALLMDELGVINLYAGKYNYKLQTHSRYSN